MSEIQLTCVCIRLTLPQSKLFSRDIHRKGKEQMGDLKINHEKIEFDFRLRSKWMKILFSLGMFRIQFPSFMENQFETKERKNTINH